MHRGAGTKAAAELQSPRASELPFFLRIRLATTGYAAELRCSGAHTNVRSSGTEDVEADHEAELRRLRRANHRKLLVFPAVIALAVIAWLVHETLTFDITNDR